VVARARWAFQVSQGSVEALFGCGGKRLQDFAANLLRKLHTIFYQNRPSLVEDITENVGLFFPVHIPHTRILFSA